MKIKTSRLEGMAALVSQYPPEMLPEVAFVGRSNVGKSTFINRFLNRKNLAYTSSTPGKTRTVNFYNVNEAFRMVDLPGYGYAQASKSAQHEWSKVIDIYLTNRPNLREVFLLVDLRHEPTALDAQMYNWIVHAGYTGYVIATKWDKIPPSKLNQHTQAIVKKLKLSSSDLLFPYAGATKKGLDRIHDLVEKIISEAEELASEELEIED